MSSVGQLQEYPNYHDTPQPSISVVEENATLNWIERARHARGRRSSSARVKQRSGAEQKPMPGWPPAATSYPCSSSARQRNAVNHCRNRFPTLRARSASSQPRQKIPALATAARSRKPPTLPPAKGSNRSAGDGKWPERDPELASARSGVIETLPTLHRRLPRRAMPLPLRLQRHT